MSKYASGARFERQIIKYLLEKGAVLVMRGAGSKSYGAIKADLIAIVPYLIEYGSGITGYKVLIIQAKHSKNNQKKAKEVFEAQKLVSWLRFLWLDKREDWKKKIDEVL